MGVQSPTMRWMDLGPCIRLCRARERVREVVSGCVHAPVCGDCSQIGGGGPSWITSHIQTDHEGSIFAGAHPILSESAQYG